MTDDHAEPPATPTDWDEWYRDRDQVWSGEPNGALVAEVAALPPGRALDVGCGEGADAIWLARRGWQVTALDVSRVALGRAAAAAQNAGLDVAWVHAGLLEAGLTSTFDLVSAQYAVLPRTADAAAERALLAAVAPGGTLLVVHHAGFGVRGGGDHDHDPDPDPDHDHAHDADHEAHAADALAPADVAALLDDDWGVEVNEQRPRHLTSGAGAHHVEDVVLRARRLR